MEPIVKKRSKNVLTVQINQTLTNGMISTLRGELDGFINEHDHIPSLEFSCKTAPHWDSLGAFADHMSMVHDQENSRRQRQCRVC